MQSFSQVSRSISGFIMTIPVETEPCVIFIDIRKELERNEFLLNTWELEFDRFSWWA